MAPGRGAGDRVILGSLMGSQGGPRVCVLCAGLHRIVQPWTALGETVHGVLTLGLHCELVGEPVAICSFVPW